MKNYSIQITHTATTVTTHTVEARNMQDAMFRLGQTELDEPFACCAEADYDVAVDVAVGSPTLTDAQSSLDIRSGEAADVEGTTAKDPA